MLTARGHDAWHTLDLPLANQTPDSVICVRADALGAAVITKDADFVISRMLHDTPERLVVIATGNISNNELLALISANLDTICAALTSPAHLEISRTTLVHHP